MATESKPQYFLFKSEPTPRMVNGTDVSYGLDEFEKDGTCWAGEPGEPVLPLCSHFAPHTHLPRPSCLAGSLAGTSEWDGVRNYAARNIMRSAKVGDMVLFYHSNVKLPGIVGIAEIAKEAYPDYTAWDPSDPHYDPKSSKDDPRWWMVDIKFVRRLKRLISLPEMKAEEALCSMQLFTRARLSVQEVTQAEYEHILQMEQRPAPAPAKAGAKRSRTKSSASKPAAEE